MVLTFSRWVIRWRWLIVIATVLIVAIAASGARFIEFSGSYRVFFSAENPQLQAFDELQNTYSKNDTVMFVLAPKNGKVFTRETLASAEWLTEQGWQMPYSRRVDSVTNFQHTRADNDDLVVKSLAENAASLTDTDLERIKNIALTEPLLLNRLISARAHVTGVNVTFVLPEKSLNEIPEVMAFARKLVAQVKEKNPDLDVYLTGVAPFNSAFQESSEKDLKTLVPLMCLVIALITFFSLRSVTGTVATLLVIIFSVITAMGMMGWLGIKLTAPSASAPTVILTLAIADSIHTLAHVKKHGR